MPEYTNVPSVSPNLMGLSPNSVRAFRNREENRFNSFSQDLQDELDEMEENENSNHHHNNLNHHNQRNRNLLNINNDHQKEEDLDEDPWDCLSDEEIDFLSPEEEDFLTVEEFVGTRIPEDELIFQIDQPILNIPSKNSQPTNRMRISNCSQRSSLRYRSLPFWYHSESPEHLEVIVQIYSHKILKKEDNSIRRDCRRLPQFIGRIHRSPIKPSARITTTHISGASSFQTLDKIDVYQRDIRQCGSLITKLSTAYLVSSWNTDGIPHIIEVIDNDHISSWRRKIIKKSDSYIYCLPVWESKTEFQFSVESEEHEVGYANQPWNYTAYLPPEFQKKDLDCEEQKKDLDCSQNN